MTKVITFLAICTFYSDAHQGKIQANGELFDKEQLTCASYLYPIGTILTVKYEGKETDVEVTDRCDDKTEIDLSEYAFSCIADLDLGRIQVEVVFCYDSQAEYWKKKYPRVEFSPSCL